MREKWKHYRAGDRAGRWVLVARAGAKADGASVWLCRCDCGTERNVPSIGFTKGYSESCGCLRRERAAAVCRSQLIGKIFGQLTVLEDVGVAPNRNRLWKVQCSCGVFQVTETRALTTGHKTSCGCAFSGSRPARAASVRQKARSIEAIRRARKAGAGGSFTEDQILRLYQDQSKKCVACERDFVLDAMCRDHIVPLALGGSNDISNIQLLCRSCNSSKGTRAMAAWLPSRKIAIQLRNQS